MDDKNSIAIEIAKRKESELILELNFIQKYIKDLGGVANLKAGLSEMPKIPIYEGAKTKSDNEIPSDYQAELSLVKKFVTILIHQNRFMHFREVADYIIKYEDLKMSTSDLSKKLTAATTRLKKNDQIVKYIVGNNNKSTFWGKPEWLTEDKEVKEEFMYDSKYIHGSNNLL